ncbi:MAG: hypothetical protein KJZ77_19095 [Anaerolineales bacterium]|nr:hypothetical protein [Anaerolineales bacterium]
MNKKLFLSVLSALVTLPVSLLLSAEQKQEPQIFNNTNDLLFIRVLKYGFSKDSEFVGTKKDSYQPKDSDAPIYQDGWMLINKGQVRFVKLGNEILPPFRIEIAKLNAEKTGIDIKNIKAFNIRDSKPRKFIRLNIVIDKKATGLPYNIEPQKKPGNITKDDIGIGQS